MRRNYVSILVFVDFSATMCGKRTINPTSVVSILVFVDFSATDAPSVCDLSDLRVSILVFVDFSATISLQHYWSLRVSFNPCFRRLFCNREKKLSGLFQSYVSILVFVDFSATLRKFPSFSFLSMLLPYI